MRTCPNGGCTNHGVGFDADEENVYCPKCGQKLVEMEDEDEED